MKRIGTIILTLIIIATLIGCDKPIITDEQNHSELEESEVYKLKSLGSAIFVVDDNNSASLYYPADGMEDATLIVTDSNGLTWQLDIPKNALLQPQRIKITAMENVRVDTLGNMRGGVVMEPDGIKFQEPVKLTVTGEGVNGDDMLLTGDNDGSNLSFALCEDKEGRVSADIFHFSTVVLPDSNEETQMRALTDLANEHYSDNLKYTKDMLKRIVDEPPIPPDIALKCKKGSHDLDINQYYNKFLTELQEPEMSAVRELLGAERYKQLLGTSANDDSFKYAISLLERIRTKVKKLVDKYQLQPEKFYATSSAFIQVERMYQFLGGENDTDWKSMQKWCENATQHYLTELIEKHDYTAIHAILRAARTLQLLGGDGDSYLQKLENVMKFELKIETDMRTMAESYFSYNLMCTIPMELQYGGDMAVSEGSGICEYISAQSPIAEYVSPNSYMCYAEITKFDPCIEGVVWVSLDKIGAEKETWSYTLSGMTYEDEALSGWLADNLFKTEDSSQFNFRGDLQNLNVNAIDQVLEKKVSVDGLDLEGSIHLTLVHKPNL